MRQAVLRTSSLIMATQLVTAQLTMRLFERLLSQQKSPANDVGP
jgi:hypothetical protein